MKAKRKPLDVYDPDELGVELTQKVEVVGGKCRRSDRLASL